MQYKQIAWEHHGGTEEMSKPILFCTMYGLPFVIPIFVSVWRECCRRRFALFDTTNLSVHFVKSSTLLFRGTFTEVFPQIVTSVFCDQTMFRIENNGGENFPLDAFLKVLIFDFLVFRYLPLFWAPYPHSWSCFSLNWA